MDISKIIMKNINATIKRRKGYEKENYFSFNRNFVNHTGRNRIYREYGESPCNESESVHRCCKHQCKLFLHRKDGR